MLDSIRLPATGGTDGASAQVRFAAADARNEGEGIATDGPDAGNAPAGVDVTSFRPGLNATRSPSEGTVFGDGDCLAFPDRGSAPQVALGDVASPAVSTQTPALTTADMPVTQAAATKTTPPVGATTGDFTAKTMGALLRADLSGQTPGAFLKKYQQASETDKAAIRLALIDVYADRSVTSWIDASPERVKQALAISTAVTPPDVATAENVKSEAKLAGMTAADWAKSPYQVIVVPGYTPDNHDAPEPGVNTVTMGRLEEAVRAYHEGKAPFIMVSGGNVHPAGTPYYEGLEMKKSLLRMGVPEEAIIVEGRARHSTTNLRNAGRFMEAHGMKKALVTPPGGGLSGGRVFDQEFYFAHPVLSTFNHRSKKELGYHVGSLHKAGSARVAYTPSPEVTRLNYKDPLDP